MKLKKLLICFLLIFLFVACVPFTAGLASADNSEAIYLGGMSSGFTLNTRGATVIGVGDVITENGLVSPANEAGIVANDVILSIDGIEVNTAKDVEKIISDGLIKQMLVKTESGEKNVNITPAKDISGKYRLGIFIRDEINGIGTVTFFKGNKVATLGHSVYDPSGSIVEVTSGDIFCSKITGYIRGKRGNPGELKGLFSESKPYAKVIKNDKTGIYGELINGIPFENTKQIETGEARPGGASIMSTISGNTVKEYEISIVKTDYLNSDNKNFVIRINDSQLLSETGGIVQGMSGSPIIQDGKLVGAVTHVFINDPTRGFGISISEMLKSLEK